MCDLGGRPRRQVRTVCRRDVGTQTGPEVWVFFRAETDGDLGNIFGQPIPAHSFRFEEDKAFFGGRTCLACSGSCLSRMVREHIPKPLAVQCLPARAAETPA